MTTATMPRADELFPFTAAKVRHYRGNQLIWGSQLELPGHVGPILRSSPLERDAIREQLWTPNALADEGEEDILSAYFDGGAAPTNFYGRLYNDTPVETDTLATLLSEAAGNGYAAVTFAAGTDWGAPALDAGDFQTTSTTKTFSATGGSWGPVTYAVLATVATGTVGLLIAYVALSASRTLQSGDTLDLSWAVKLA